MEDQNTIYELMKEYRINVAGMDEPVYGKIWKIMGEDNYTRFCYDFSHFFLPGENADYSDERITRESYDQVEIIVLQYLRDFTTEYGEPKKNSFFK
ncbi:MAG: hypothetical protein EOO06_00445 [Chitinophagaceae bacterium]|nr:MAG: hypothetical protein EOO06_00445 [Chitinophagaceae bacterium]